MKAVNTTDISKSIVDSFTDYLSGVTIRSGLSDEDKKNLQKDIGEMLSNMLGEVPYGFALDEDLEYQGTHIMELNGTSILCLHDIAADMVTNHLEPYLEKNGIMVPDAERTGDATEGPLYGQSFSDLQELAEDVMMEKLNGCENGITLVTHIKSDLERD